jgi:hypothetical protein
MEDTGFVHSALGHQEMEKTALSADRTPSLVLAADAAVLDEE